MAKTKIADQAQFEHDVLHLETAAVMKKYKIGKQAVYDKRYALKKKGVAPEGKPPKPSKQKVAASGKKRGPKPKVKPVVESTVLEETAVIVAQLEAPKQELAVVSKRIPVIHKPIEINFENFSIKLNGVPKKISVNPDTNEIEIDL